MEIDVRIVATPRQRKDAFAVRIAVFVDEQRIPRSEELDEADTSAIHCTGYVEGKPVAAGRLLIAPVHDNETAYAKVGRMAVLKQHRGTGLGARVLRALEQAGIDRGVRTFRLSAQLSAQGFYAGQGYTPIGDVYDEVGIPHVAMEKRVLDVGRP
jgi:predicted GNAT family N-acyltransferase